MVTKDKRRLFETDQQMELTLRRVADLLVKPTGDTTPSSILSDRPHEEVVDRVIKKVRKL